MKVVALNLFSVTIILGFHSVVVNSAKAKATQTPTFRGLKRQKALASTTTTIAKDNACAGNIAQTVFAESLASSSINNVSVKLHGSQRYDKSWQEKLLADALQVMREASPPELSIEPQVQCHDSIQNDPSSMFQSNDAWKVIFTTPNRDHLLGLPPPRIPGGIVGSSLIVQPNDPTFPMSCNFPICHRGPNSKEPAACATQMFEALSIITDWMDQNSMEYVLMYGTLLGAYRQNDIIPWTGDLDIGVSQKDFQKLVDQKDIPWHFSSAHKLEIPRGCEAHHPGFPGKYQENPSVTDPSTLMSSWGSYYIDFYPFEMEKWYHPGCLEKQSDGTHRKSQVQIRGKSFHAPTNIESCLRSKYGEGWRTPDPTHSWHGAV